MRKALLVPLLLLLISFFTQAGEYQVVILKSQFTNKSELDSLTAILERAGNTVQQIDALKINAQSPQKESVVIYHR